MAFWIPLAMMAAQLGGQAFASNKSAEANNNVRRYLDDRIGEANSYYGSLLGQNYLDSAEAKSSLSAMREGMKKNLQALNNNGVAKGMTDEGRVAAAGELNDRFAQGMNRIAANGTAYKQGLRSAWRSEKNNLEGQKMGLQAADAAKYGQMGNNIANAVGAGLYAYGTLGNNTAAGNTGQAAFDINKVYDAGSNNPNAYQPNITPLYT